MLHQAYDCHNLADIMRNLRAPCYLQSFAGLQEDAGGAETPKMFLPLYFESQSFFCINHQDKENKQGSSTDFDKWQSITKT